MAKPIKGRTTVYNSITSAEKLERVEKKNLELETDFLDYLASIDRSSGTIKQYQADLHIFWCWNLEFNDNKFFVDLSKREIARFQHHAINEWKWSPKRMRRVKSTLSSLSNYVENILDDEYKGYKPIIRKIESPADDFVRVKTIFQMEELQPLLDRLVEEKEYLKACVLALAMYSGKRKSELTRFKVSYFDDKNLICDGALYKTPEKMTTKGRGKRGKLLYVYVLAKPFKPYLDLWLNERKNIPVESDWLFPLYRDGKWTEEHIGISLLDSMTKMFSRYLGKPFYFHSMRHAFTTYLLEQNLPENVVQSIQGWATSDMLRIYDDRSNESQLEKYFGASGIKEVKQATLQDI